MPDNIFNDDNSNDTDVNFLDQLVGEGKKFKTVEDLARGKAESDRYVDQLRSELDNQRKLNEEKLDQLLESVKNKSTNTANGNTQTPTNQNTSGSPDGGNTSPNDAGSDIESLVKKALKEQEDLTRKEANVQVVTEKLTELYGEKASNVVKTRANELGMSVKQLEEMASTSPKAFLTLVTGEKAESNSLNTTQTRVNSQSLSENNKPVGTGWSYYKELKKKNPSEFWKRHGEIYQKVQEMGHDKFYNS